MVFYILTILKTYIFLGLINVNLNKLSLLGLSSLISIIIISKILEGRSANKNKWAFIYYSFFSLVLFADAMYYAQFRAMPSVALLKQAGQLTAVGDSIKVLLNVRILMLILDLPILLILKRVFKLDIYRDYYFKMPLYLRRYIMWSLLGLLIVRTGIHGQLESIYNQELYSYHIKDIYSQTIGGSQIEASRVFTQKELEELEERTKLKPGKYTGVGNRKNLIVIQVEALQNFIIDFEYEGVEVTPNINKLIKEEGSLYYDRYYQLVGRGNTSDAEFVTNNSLHPPMEEPSYTKYEKNTFYGLPIILKEQEGYTPWVFHGYEKEFWNRNKAYVNQGFERFLSEEDFLSTEPIGFGLNDREFFQQGIEYLKELDSIDDNPFYAFMITLTSHTPFNMPEKYEVIDILPEHKGTMFGNYINSIHYADKYIGKFIEDLKKEGLYDDTVIALYGDHFALIAEDKEIKENMDSYLGINYNYDSMMNIPLVIHVPGEKFNERVSKVGSQKDFLPTILNIMGYENEKGLMFGHDLNNYEESIIVNPQAYIRKGSFIYEDYMFTLGMDVVFDHGNTFDIKTGKIVERPDFIRDVYEEAIREINMCDFLLSNNILDEYIKNNKKIDLNKYSGDKDKTEDIVYLNEPKIEEIEDAYINGAKVIGMELAMDWKNRVVVKRSDLKIFELINYLEGKDDLKFLFYDREENPISLVRIGKDYPEIKNSSIIEMKDFSKYLAITYDEVNQEEGINNIILDTVSKGLEEEDVLDFTAMHSLSGVILDKKDFKKDYLLELKSRGIKIYTRREEVKGLRNMKYRKYIDAYVDEY